MSNNKRTKTEVTVTNGIDVMKVPVYEKPVYKIEHVGNVFDEDFDLDDFFKGVEETVYHPEVFVRKPGTRMKRSINGDYYRLLKM